MTLKNPRFNSNDLINIDHISPQIAPTYNSQCTNIWSCGGENWYCGNFGICYGSDTHCFDTLGLLCGPF